jgi:hypothetical protein
LLDEATMARLLAEGATLDNDQLESLLADAD